MEDWLMFGGVAWNFFVLCREKKEREKEKQKGPIRTLLYYKAKNGYCTGFLPRTTDSCCPQAHRASECRSYSAIGNDLLCSLFRQ
jgi:hypothetical protein